MRFIAGLCSLLTALAIAVPGAAQENAASKPNVTVAAVQKQNATDKGRYVGRVEAVTMVNVQARVQGILEKRNFEEGGLVKKGDLLYVIEKDLYQADVANAKAQLEGAQATLKNSQINLERQAVLLSEGDISQSTYDAAKATVGSDQASVDEAKANLDTATINLGFTDIYSPIDGRISKSIVDAGNLVDSNTGTLATITSVDPIQVNFFMGEKDLIEDREKGLIGTTSAALNVKLTLANGSDYPQTGSINYVAPTVEQASDTVEVHAVFANPKNVLMPGQFVNVIIEDADPKPTLVIPQAAVQLDRKGHFVYLVDSADKVERRDVQLGRQAGGVWEVASGLKEGEKVVVQGLQRIHPGITVNPTETKG